MQSNCNWDSDCRLKSFCNDQNPDFRICTECYDCIGRYNRLDARDGCARTKDECGSCLNGYEEDKLTGNRIADKCQPAVTQKPDTTTTEEIIFEPFQDEDDNFWMIVIGICVSVTVLGILFGISVCVWTRIKSNHSVNTISGTISGQLPFNPHHPTAPTDSDIERQLPSYEESQSLINNPENSDTFRFEITLTREEERYEPQIENNRKSGAEPFNTEEYENRLREIRLTTPDIEEQEIPEIPDAEYNDIYDGISELWSDLSSDAGEPVDDGSLSPAGSVDSRTTQVSYWTPNMR